MDDAAEVMQDEKRRDEKRREEDTKEGNDREGTRRQYKRNRTTARQWNGTRNNNVNVHKDVVGLCGVVLGWAGRVV